MAQVITDRPLFFPNVENVIAAFLAMRPELSGISVGVVLPPDFDGGQRAVVSTRLGGAFAQDDGLDDAIVRIDTYGKGKLAAHTVASAVRGVLPLLPQVGAVDGVVVTDIEENQGPCWAPDRVRGNADRYVMRYRLVVRIRAVPA